MQALLLTDVPRAAQASGYVQHLAVAGVMLLVQLALASLLSLKLTRRRCFLIAGALLSVHWTRAAFAADSRSVQSVEDSAARGSGFMRGSRRRWRKAP